MNKETSEFGKGFIYNLILFAKHFENSMAGYKVGDRKEDYGIWFNGASDHLYELDVPEKFKDTQIGKKAKELQDLALDIGHGKRMMEEGLKDEYLRAVELTKEIGILIDIELGLNPIKGQYE